jgi:hypothetical protein
MFIYKYYDKTIVDVKDNTNEINYYTNDTDRIKQDISILKNYELIQCDVLIENAVFSQLAELVSNKETSEELYIVLKDKSLLDDVISYMNTIKTFDDTVLFLECGCYIIPSSVVRLLFMYNKQRKFSQSLLKQIDILYEIGIIENRVIEYKLPTNVPNNVDNDVEIEDIKPNILLIGNSRQVLNTTFIEKQDIKLKHVCRFNYNWAHIYDKIKTLTGDKFDTLITSNFAHKSSIEELKQFDLIDNVEKVYLICPNIHHKYPISKDPTLNYEEILDEEYTKINTILKSYNFPLHSKNPRTGLLSIIYFHFIKNFKVYIYGFDIEGIDDPYDQHVHKNIKIDERSHCMKSESMILKRLINEQKLFVY